MIVGMRRSGFRGMGDAVEDALAGADGSAVLSVAPVLHPVTDDSLSPPPAWAMSSTASGPASSLQNTSGGWGFSWNDLAKTITGTAVNTLLGRPSMPTPPPRPVSAGISPGLIVAGVAGVVIVGALLLRGSRS